MYFKNWPSWCFLLILTTLRVANGDDDDFSILHRDGSYQFGYKTPDSYHNAVANRNNVVRGEFGGRNPETRRIDTTVYTAGPRGYRPKGVNIHRHYDQNQHGPRPIGSRDDPYYDPYEDPSYDFRFRTRTYNRQENADRVGNVVGKYNYYDDVGDRHDVEFVAGKNTGFHVKTPFPDSNPERFEGRLFYLDPRKPHLRGRTAIQRGVDGSYKFLAVGPDQRRTEVSDSTGHVRGSYTYKDDKGVLHSVHYIAGPEIGYRVLKNVKGPHFPILYPFTRPNQIPPGVYDHIKDSADLFDAAASGHVKPINAIGGGAAAGGGTDEDKDEGPSFGGGIDIEKEDVDNIDNNLGQPSGGGTSGSRPPLIGSGIDGSRPPPIGGGVDESRPPPIGGGIDGSRPPPIGGGIDGSRPPPLDSGSRPPSISGGVDGNRPSPIGSGIDGGRPPPSSITGGTSAEDGFPSSDGSIVKPPFSGGAGTPGGGDGRPPPGIGSEDGGNVNDDFFGDLLFGPSGSPSKPFRPPPSRPPRPQRPSRPGGGGVVPGAPTDDGSYKPDLGDTGDDGSYIPPGDVNQDDGIYKPGLDESGLGGGDGFRPGSTGGGQFPRPGVGEGGGGISAGRPGGSEFPRPGPSEGGGGVFAGKPGSPEGGDLPRPGLGGGGGGGGGISAGRPSRPSRPRPGESSFTDDYENEDSTGLFGSESSNSRPPISGGGRPPLIQIQGGGGQPGCERCQGTLVTNLGDRPFSVPPGVSVRAHVQSIDLLPLSIKVPSPSEQYMEEMGIKTEQLNSAASDLFSNVTVIPDSHELLTTVTTTAVPTTTYFATTEATATTTE